MSAFITRSETCEPARDSQLRKFVQFPHTHTHAHAHTHSRLFLARGHFLVRGIVTRLMLFYKARDYVIRVFARYNTRPIDNGHEWDAVTAVTVRSIYTETHSLARLHPYVHAQPVHVRVYMQRDNVV